MKFITQLIVIVVITWSWMSKLEGSCPYFLDSLFVTYLFSHFSPTMNMTVVGVIQFLFLFGIYKWTKGPHSISHLGLILWSRFIFTWARFPDKKIKKIGDALNEMSKLFKLIPLGIFHDLFEFWKCYARIIWMRIPTFICLIIRRNNNPGKIPIAISRTMASRRCGMLR